MSDDAPDDARISAERRAFSMAREHVGAAGFAQRDALERLINAGREQIRFTQSLREVMTTTLTQLHALPLMDLHQTAEPHIVALENIVQASHAQLATADELRDNIQHALTQLRGTPVEHVSAQLLNNLSQVVHRQAADLQALVNLALNEASTVQHIAALEQVSTRVQTHLLVTEREQSEQMLVQLDRAGQSTLERIRALEASGVTHAAQKAQLERENEAAQAHVAELEADAARNDQKIAHLERQAEVVQAHTAALEAAALRTQEKIARLRLQLEAQQANEQRQQPSHDN